MKKRQLTLAVLLFLGALLVRMPGMGHHSLWFDEVSTAFNITQQDLFKSITTTESTPPLFFYLEKYVIQWFGFPITEWSLRLLPLLFDAGTCVLYFFIFSTISNAKLGFLSYVLITVGNYSIASALDARVYTLFTLMALFSLWSTLKWWQSPGWKGATVLIVSIGLLMQCHYYAIFWVGALLLSVILVKMHDLRLKRYLCIVTFTAIFSALSLVNLLTIQSDYQFDESKHYLLIKWLPGIVYTPVKILIGAYLFKIHRFSDITLLDLAGIVSAILIIVFVLITFFRRLYLKQIADNEKILSYALLIAYSIHIATGWIIPCVHPQYTKYHLVLLFGFIVINTAHKKWAISCAITLLVAINVTANFKYFLSHKPYMIPWRTVGATIDTYVKNNGGNPLPVLAHYSICLPVGFYVHTTSVPFYHICSPMNPDSSFSFAKLTLFRKDFYTQLYHYRYFRQQGSTSFMHLVTELRRGILIDKIETPFDQYIAEFKQKYSGIIDFKVLSRIETNQGTVFLVDWRYTGVQH